MSRFIQLHLLISYPPSNPNRDDLGRPKTAVMGGANRLRISSQSLKRAWRKSEIFEMVLKGHQGIRTKSIGTEIFNVLTGKGIAERSALEWAYRISREFVKKPGEHVKIPPKLELSNLKTDQLVHISAEEKGAIDTLVEKLVEEKTDPTEVDLGLLKKISSTTDIALFGRMLAANPVYNVDASMQVAHAISVHKVAVEDDFFTAVDDLNRGDEDRGSGHMGDTEFAAALFYLYVCIDRESLINNLGGNKALANKTLGAVLEAIAKVPPGGKQNSFANRVYASYILAEKGSQQPRSLAVAYLKPVSGDDMASESITALETTRANMDKVYGPCADDSRRLNAAQGEGSLAELIRFIQE